MKTKRFMILLLICIIAISGCSDEVPGEGATPEDAGMDNVLGEVDEGAEDAEKLMDIMPDAAALYSEFAGNDTYKQWSIWPGKESMMEGNGIHGDYVSIYVSDNALSAAESGESLMPFKTMVVKEGFNADEELIGIYLMYKEEGFDPGNNDWFWATYSADGDVKSEGKVGGCISCHEGANDADYIFVNS